MRSGSLWGLICDLVLADKGPDLERVFMAGLSTLFEVGLGVLAALPTLDLAGLDVAGRCILAVAPGRHKFQLYVVFVANNVFHRVRRLIV